LRQEARTRPPNHFPQVIVLGVKHGRRIQPSDAGKLHDVAVTQARARKMARKMEDAGNVVVLDAQDISLDIGR
jgi:hypothetical protein